jgi:transposase
VREAARASTPLTPATPERPKRRTFTAEFKQRILREADVALASGTDGAIGELLRREGLYSSHLTEWRRQRDAGERAGLTPQKRGRKATRSAHADEMERLQRRVALLETELKKAETIIDVQKNFRARERSLLARNSSSRSVTVPMRSGRLVFGASSP